MCGRFVQKSKKKDVEERFGVVLPSENELRPRYNLAPGQPALIIADGPKHRPRADFASWGLIPSWAKDPRIGYKMINARVETLWEKASYRNPLRYRRCLVPANGFYEWEQGPGKSKRPWLFAVHGEPVFAFAGLWEVWNDRDGGELFTFTLITCPANESMRPIHHRMPLILNRAQEHAWLDHRLHRPEDLQPLLAGGGAVQLDRHRVAPLVNSPTNDSPACLEPFEETQPVEAPDQLDLFGGADRPERS